MLKPYLLALAVLAAAQGGPGAASSVPGSAQIPEAATDVRVLSTRGGRFDPLTGRLPQPVPRGLKTWSPEPGRVQPMLVQFDREVGAAERGWLEGLGMPVLRYLPHRTLLVQANAAQLAALDGKAGIRWTGVFQPRDKIDLEEIVAFAAQAGAPTLPGGLSAGTGSSGEKGDQGVAPGGGDLLHLEVALFPGAHAGELLTAANAAAPTARQDALWARPWGGVLRIEVATAELESAAVALANRPEVEAVSVWVLPELHNDHSIYIVQSYDLTGRTNYAVSATIWNENILGTGEIVAFSDTGLDADSCFFKYSTGGATAEQTPVPPDPGTLDPSKKVIGHVILPQADVTGDNSHGTHVAGIVAGDNHATLSTPTLNGHDSADGMAPQAQLFAQDISSAGGSLAGLRGDPYELSQQAFNAGARIQTNSWGSSIPSGPAPYDDSTLAKDLFTWDNEEFLHVFSIGNRTFPYNFLARPSVGKNVLGVGAATHGSATSNSSSVASFSVEGPTADGRVKPDVITPGQSVVSAGTSASPNNCNASTKSGTSMAAPTAAGTAALVRQYYADGFYPDGSASAADAFSPSAALVKATLINSADDVGAANIPNKDEGWGRVHLDNTLAFGGSASDLRIRDRRNLAGLTTGQEDVLTIQAGNGQPLKVTLVWSDPPAAMSAGINLVNNLDLEVTGPGGTFKGNVLTAGVSTTGGSADALNNVEQVVLPSPASGSYTVRVKATSVPGNGFTPQSDRQGYALVIRADGCNPGGGGGPSSLAAVDNGVNGIDLTWSATGSPAGFEIYRAPGTCGAPAGPFTYVGDSTSTTFTDVLADGGFSYAYQVRWYNACGLSPVSNCADALASGNCTLQPLFDGVTSVVQDPATAACDLTVSWSPAASSCPLSPTVSYNVYRDTTPYFVTGPGNLVVSGLTGTSHSETVDSLTTYYYRVRAEDGTTANGGPANGGNEDGGDTVAHGTARGLGTSPGTFIDDGGDTFALLELESPWTVTSEQNHTPSGGLAYHSNADGSLYPNNACTAATTPAIDLQQGTAPVLSYWALYNLEWAWDGVVVEISTDDGATWETLPLTTADGQFFGDYFTDFSGSSSPINGCGYQPSQGAINGPPQQVLTPWLNFTHDMAAYAGRTVRLRWVLSSDPGVVYEGFYLDDIEITSASVLLPCGSAGSVILDRSQYNCADSVGVTVQDVDLAGLGSLPSTAFLSSVSEPAAEAVGLAETAAASGIFQGSFPTTLLAPSSGDGLLSVSHGGSLTALYTDADDGGGGTNVLTTDTAAVDCVPPVIAHVFAVDVTGESARIIWDTSLPADSLVEFGTSLPGGAVVSSVDPVTSHSLDLTGLTPCTPYQFRVASTDAAGNFTEDDNGGAYFTFTTPMSATPVHASSDTPIAIPGLDPAGITSVITTADGRAVRDLDVELDITHPNDFEMIIRLRAPDSTEIELSGRVGIFSADYIDTILDDEAATAINNGTNVGPFTGRFKPIEPLAEMNGIPLAGSWTLEVVDDIDLAGPAAGTLQGWSLQPTLDLGWCGAHASMQGSAVASDVCPAGGPADGFADPGELVELSLSLHNDGALGLTGVTATVTPLDAGVFMTDAVASFPTMAPGGVTTSPAPHVTAGLPTSLTCGASLRFRIDIVSDQGSWSEPFTLTVGNPFSGTATALFEDFSAGIPGTWTVVNGGNGGGTASTWTTSNPGGHLFWEPVVKPAAMVDSNAAGASANQDEELITPLIDLTAAAGVTLEFDHHMNRFSTEIADVDVRSSLTSGVWTTVLGSLPTSPDPESRSVDITSQAAGAADVQIRFRYHNGNDDWWWWVDNVRVSYTAPATCNAAVCAVPPPVPDGSVGTALTVTAVDTGSNLLDLNWDVTTCPASGYHLLYGDLAGVGSYTVAGAECAIGTSGVYPWTGSPGTSTWFLVVADDGTSTEGSWGTDSAGNQRKGQTPSGFCGMVNRGNTGTCPP